MILNPALLLGIPIFIGCLIYIYKNRGKYVKKVVSTLLFFRGNKQESSKKIRIPPRFFLETLIASLLIFIVAGLAGVDKHYLVVMDNSLSTGRTYQGKTLLEIQKENARNEILSRTTGAFSIITTNPAEFILRDSPSFIASEALSKIGVSIGEDKLQSLIDQNQKYDEILVFSDKELRADNIENIAITSANFISNSELEIRVTKKADISIEGTGFKKNLNVDSQVIVEVPVDEVKVRITSLNLNRFDDEVLVSKKNQNLIELVSPFSELGLNNLGQFKFSKNEGEVRLIHRSAIPEKIDRPTAVIAPSNLSYEKLSISRWDKDSELTRYAELSLFAPKEVAPINIPGQALIYAEGRPILKSTIKDGFPLVVLGFEILPYEGKRTPTSSVLLINLLKFLTKNLKESFYIESESFPTLEKIVVPELAKSFSNDSLISYYILLVALILLLIDGLIRW